MINADWRLYPMKANVSAVVGLLITALLVGALGVTIFSNFSALAADGNLTTTEKAIVGVLGVFVAIGFLYMILRQTGVWSGK